MLQMGVDLVIMAALLRWTIQNVAMEQRVLHLLFAISTKLSQLYVTTLCTDK